MKKESFRDALMLCIRSKSWKIMHLIAVFLILGSFQVFANSALSQQPRTVTGTVTDPSGVPLPGVTVVVAGTTQGTITDFDGNFSLPDVESGDILQFSFVGMLTQDIEVVDQTEFNIEMEEQTIGLEEVIAIGYGVTTRQNFTGSVTELDLEDSPQAISNATNALSLLRGVTTGVTVTQGGEAGAEAEIQIRGQRSLDEDAGAPLLVVNGVIFSGNMNDIDPGDIESIQILKDATTLAAYGSKAANGVVMITTKKGRIGKPTLSFSSYATITTPGFEPKMRDAEGYIKLMEYRSNLPEGSDPALWMGDLELANYEAGNTTDWIDYIDRTGVLQNYSLSFSGASETSNYYLSGSFVDQQGNYYGDNYQRYTFNANITTNITDNLELNANTMFAYNKDWGISPSYGAAVTLSPLYPTTLSDGSMRKFVDGKEIQTVNPLWNTFNGMEDESYSKNNVFGGYLDYNIPGVEGLSFKVTGSYTINTDERRRFTHETNFPDIALGEDGYTPEVYDQRLIDANGRLDYTERDSWIWDNILTYLKQIDNHFINASLVYTRNSSKREYRGVEGSDFRGIGNTLLGYYGLANADVPNIRNFEYSLHNDVGYLARINYSFDNTYHLNASVRRDGSSVFGSDKKWGTFPAVGFAWTMSNESFMSGISAINDLKLKLSWGKNGNQSLSPYGTLSTIALGRSGDRPYYFGDQVYYGQRITELGNAALGWESTESINYGFDATLMTTMSLSVDAYNSKTTDQIFDRNIPVMGSGLDEQKATMGQVNNWGLEINLTNRNITKGDFSWQTGLIFYMNRNKLAELYGDGQDDIGESLFIGKSLGAIYGYVWDGIVQEGEENYLENVEATPGDAKFKDISGPDGVPDNRLTDDDRKILGYEKENFQMSLSNTLSYKNFDLYILFRGVFAGNGYGLQENNSAYITEDQFFYHNTLDHPFWTPSEPSEIYPRWNYRDPTRFTALQSYGFVRLQDVNLSYTFDSATIESLGITRLQVYASASNLFFIAPDWEGSDPEVRRYDRAQLPRTFKFGLNLNF